MVKVKQLVVALVVGLLLASAGAASAAGTVGTSFPAGFPAIVDASLGIPVIGFGAAGELERTPVVFLHGNNDTPFATACNPYGNVHDMAQYFLDHGYRASPGMVGDNIHVLNPGATSATVTISLPGASSIVVTVNPGAEVHVTFAAGKIGGPVTITSTQPILAAQRVQYYQSFNELTAS